MTAATGSKVMTAFFDCPWGFCFLNRPDDAHTMSASLANTEGWAVNSPTLSQFLLPPTVVPRGVKTKASVAAMSIGQANFQTHRTDIRATLSMMTTPAAVHRVLRSEENVDNVAHNPVTYRAVSPRKRVRSRKEVVNESAGRNLKPRRKPRPCCSSWRWV